MNRFEHTRLPLSRIISVAIPSITFVILLVIFLNGIRSLNQTSYDKHQESLENALNRSISQCYAVEGVYPPSLDYIIEHYGLTDNEDLFIVDYNYYGGNLLPEVTVLRKQK